MLKLEKDTAFSLPTPINIWKLNPWAVDESQRLQHIRLGQRLQHIRLGQRLPHIRLALRLQH